MKMCVGNASVRELIPDPREPYVEWTPEVARISRILTVYRLVSGPRWGEREFEELLDLYHKWIRADLRHAPAPNDPQEGIYLGALYVCQMTNDWFDHTRTILDLGLRDAGEGQVARPVFDLTMESPLSLLGYIYFRLAQDLTRAARFGRCRECGTIFKTERGDRRTYHGRHRGPGADDVRPHRLDWVHASSSSGVSTTPSPSHTGLTAMSHARLRRSGSLLGCLVAGPRRLESRRRRRADRGTPEEPGRGMRPRGQRSNRRGLQ